MGKSGKPRPRRSRDEWQRLIENQAASGQTQAVFCAEHGVSVASLQNWKRRLAVPEPAPWLELGTLVEAKSTSWDIELDLGEGLCLRLRLRLRRC
jgi:hypothetical protein